MIRHTLCFVTDHMISNVLFQTVPLNCTHKNVSEVSKLGLLARHIKGVVCMMLQLQGVESVTNMVGVVEWSAPDNTLILGLAPGTLHQGLEEVLTMVLLQTSSVHLYRVVLGVRARFRVFRV